MLIFRILSHPYTMMFAFLLILISGEHFMGFYIFYILLALPHGGVHAILAVVGLAIIILTYLQFQRRKVNALSATLNISGLLCLFLSVWYFFTLDDTNYNRSTFREGLPFSSLIFAGIIALCFLVDNVYVQWQRQSKST